MLVSGVARSPYRSGTPEGAQGSVVGFEDEGEGRESGLLSPTLSSSGGREGEESAASEFGTIVPFWPLEVAGAEGSDSEKFSFSSHFGWRTSASPFSKPGEFGSRPAEAGTPNSGCSSSPRRGDGEESDT